MEYIGEHIGYGKVGNVFVILSFIFALISTISYFFATKENIEAASWKRMARISFRLHSFSIFGIVITLFMMLQNHYFEYEYVWHHSSKGMEMKYILSCFWEGQEGSFLLWSFWHVVIGLILQRTAKEWENHVMITISLVQVFLATMLLGVFIFEKKIGTNPFTILLREHPDFANIPLFSDPNYLEKLDGRGLNPLLQNYWMTIHPPTLFLGFALTIVPFAYALAGLMQKKYSEWIKPALPWTFLGIMVLGIGVLMGGAWAYEALSFGGFWAWDPVENSSLVPWLTLVGAAHLMLINKNKGQSLFTTFIMTIITFVLILYSTFLTRSGILGESSVHAFTDLGMTGQLLIYLLFFLFLGIYLLLVDKKLRIIYAILTGVLTLATVAIGYGTYMLMAWFVSSIVFLIWSQIKFFPKPTEEEEGIWSREFWMFVGSIILLVSSFQIMFYTSMPVWNKLFDTNKAPATDVIAFYNSWQVPFAILVTLLIAIGQFFKHKDTDIKFFIKKITLSLVVSFALSALLMYVLNYTQKVNALLLFSSVFAAVANADYFIRVLKGKIKKGGASIAHIGFALIMLGALISTSKKDFISQNTSGKSVESLGKSFSNNDNILLTQGDTLPMGKYYVSYIGKRKKGVNIYFDVDYFTKNPNGTYKKEFSLAPLLQTNPKMGNVAEPDTKHYLTFDVYTHVTYASLEDIDKPVSANSEEYGPAKVHELSKGDTAFSSNAIIIFDSLTTIKDKTKYHLGENDIAVNAHIQVVSMNKKQETNPIYIIRNNMVESISSTVNELGLQFTFGKINPENGKIEIAIQEKKSNTRDFIVMQAMVFPGINILWLGCIIMGLGTLLAVIERIKKNKK